MTASWRDTRPCRQTCAPNAHFAAEGIAPRRRHRIDDQQLQMDIIVIDRLPTTRHAMEQPGRHFSQLARFQIVLLLYQLEID
jgi:hypothetical protein